MRWWRALVYVDAVAPAVGETNNALVGTDSALAGKPDDGLYDKAAYPGAPAGAADLYLEKDVFLKNFGSDLPADVAGRLWAGQRAVSTVAFSTPAAAAAGQTIPSWFFISSGDQIITSTSKKQMAQRAHAHVTDFDGGSHLRLISHPEVVAQVIEQAADSALTAAQGSLGIRAHRSRVGDVQRVLLLGRRDGV